MTLLTTLSLHHNAEKEVWTNRNRVSAIKHLPTLSLSLHCTWCWKRKSADTHSVHYAIKLLPTSSLLHSAEEDLLTRTISSSNLLG